MILNQLIQRLGRLPGLGPRSGRRVALHLLKRRSQVFEPLIRSLQQAYDRLKPCGICGFWDETDPCHLCSDLKRNKDILCVVTDMADVWALERTGCYQGVYHVLGGLLSALEGIGPDQLTIDALVERVRAGNFSEVIMATNPNVEGDGTALFISNQLAEYPVALTRLARGVTSGSVLEFTNKEILADALSGRQKL
jgi:recombination protein RecR